MEVFFFDFQDRPPPDPYGVVGLLESQWDPLDAGRQPIQRQGVRVYPHTPVPPPITVSPFGVPVLLLRVKGPRAVKATEALDRQIQTSSQARVYPEKPLANV